ncbi:MAG: polyprenol monophosphomannose synthase [Anaerolineae bacterium]|nr:polyprenol monophosphomannose synthase [Anaerolineae bacterium]MDW8072183.1 polyprenol monophosphomannose synthase [Anaerolineae bacterium]
MTDISLILPTYNERENIIPLIQRALAALADYQVEIIVVDDDSPDGTWREVANLAEHNARVRLIHRTQERGLTTAIATGIAQARGRWVAWMDCDLSMPPEDLTRLAQALESGADMAVGSRYLPGGGDVGHSWTALAFSRVINWGASLLLDRRLTDYTSGFVMARREVLAHIPLRGDYGEYCIDLLYRALRMGFRIVEVPYVCVPRQAGESKTATNLLGFFRRGWKYVITVLRLRLGI